MILFIVVKVTRDSNMIESVWDTVEKAHIAKEKYIEQSKRRYERADYYTITRELNTLRKSVLEQG